MADQPTAVDAQGALSTGDNSNTAFTEPARVGDVAYSDIAPPAGKQHPAADIFADAARLSLAEVGPWDDVSAPIGGPLRLEPWANTVRVWVKAAQEMTAPKLILPPSGYIDLPSNGVAAGSAGSDSGAAGSAVEIAPVGGSAGSESGAAGAAVEIAPVSGSAGSESSASGAATEAGAAPVSGSAGSTSGAAGAVGEVGAVSGSAASSSAASGSATVVQARLETPTITSVTLGASPSCTHTTSAGAYGYFIQYRRVGDVDWLDYSTSSSPTDAPLAVPLTGVLFEARMQAVLFSPTPETSSEWSNVVQAWRAGTIDLYMRSAAPGATFTQKGSWNQNTAPVLRSLSSAFGGTSVTESQTKTGSTTQDVLKNIHVSEPYGMACTLSVTSTRQWEFESNAAMNAFRRVHVWVSVGDTDVVRGTIVSFVSATEMPTTGAGVNTTITATPVAIQPGDRLVVEVGARATAAYSFETRVDGTVAQPIGSGAGCPYIRTTLAVTP